MATESLRIERHDGDREALRPLFELAEDSPAQLDCYIEAGTVLVAVSGDELVGHLQLVEAARPEAREIKNIAVSPLHQRRGVGRSLVCRRARAA